MKFITKERVAFAIILPLTVATFIGIQVSATQKDATEEGNKKYEAHKWGFYNTESKGSHLESFAELLGVSVEELKSAKESGTFQGILEKSGVSMGELHGRMKSHKTEFIKAHLDEAVKSGKLTQEEADAKLEKIKSHTFKKGTHSFKDRKFQHHSSSF
jgi:hypothetical protein